MGRYLNYRTEYGLSLVEIKRILADVRKTFVVTRDFSPKDENLGSVVLKNSSLDTLLESRDFEITDITSCEAVADCSPDLTELLQVVSAAEKDFKAFWSVVAGVEFKKRESSQTYQRCEYTQVSLHRRHKHPSFLYRTVLKDDAARFRHFCTVIEAADLPMKITRAQGAYKFEHLAGAEARPSTIREFQDEVSDGFHCEIPGARAQKLIGLIRTITAGFGSRCFCSRWFLSNNPKRKAEFLSCVRKNLAKLPTRKVEVSFTHRLPALEKIDALLNYSKPSFSTGICKFTIRKPPEDWPEDEHGIISVETTKKGHRMYFALTGFLSRKEIAKTLNLKLL